VTTAARGLHVSWSAWDLPPPPSLYRWPHAALRAPEHMLSVTRIFHAATDTLALGIELEDRHEGADAGAALAAVAARVVAANGGGSDGGDAESPPPAAAAVADPDAAAAAAERPLLWAAARVHAGFGAAYRAVRAEVVAQYVAAGRGRTSRG